MAKQIFSCYCLFDVCCVVKANNDSLHEFGVRI